ncbi:MAG: glycoside hydrolase family 16 protein [Treponema sp.]|uniref:glycoside hydrolase family 16 protein n=1 Tax=Treponema sp. TaxID=166 RepID=UPI0025DFE8D0|nr:glycoside hydrolase family 16 protein [Treponema sp.]MBR0496065.1 glycoside hydrolase family 16 protein [Treponema sp.]
MKKTVKCALLLSSLFWISAFASCSVSDDNPAAGTGQSSFANSGTNSASSGSGTGGGSGTNGESTSGNNQNGTSGSGTNNGNNGSGADNSNQGNNNGNSGGNDGSGNNDSNNNGSSNTTKTITNYLFSSETGISDINAEIVDWGNGGSHTIETVSGIGKVLKVNAGNGWGASAVCLPFQIRSLASCETLSFKIYVSDMNVTNPASDKDIVVKIPEVEIPFALSEYGKAISEKSGWYKVTIPLNLSQWASVRTSENRIAILQRCTGSLKITDIALTKQETASNPNVPQAEAAGAYRSGMSIVWQDEFDSSDPDGTPLSSKWGYDVGRGQSVNTDGTNPGNWAWGNGEIQWYSDNNKDNTFVSNGTLKIVAKKENAPNNDATWTSGRLVTRNIYENKYGCIEMRAKITEARGMWPAFWMLRHDIYDEGGTGWPKGGEIDIMESSTSIWGPGKVYGTLHCDAGSGGNPIFTKGTVLSSLDENWHTYAVVWNENGTISWYYDDILLGTYTAADKNNNACWPYDENFYIILNLAVGGNLGGAVDPNLREAVMEVDYVRWYK